MGIIVNRYRDETKFKKLGNWSLVYGRRKTGKTFFVKNFAKWDEYFFVKEDGSIFSETDNTALDYKTFLPLLRRLLSEGKRIVIDEFHRLPRDFLDFLHYYQKGALTIISSTLHLSKEILSKKSPILGLFSEFPFSLIDERDILKNIKRVIKNKKDLIEYCVYLREPLLLRTFKKGDARENIANSINSLKLGIPALVGEIFSEEERELSKIYEGILRCISNGKNTSSEIASYLFGRNLIKKENQSMIQQYFVNLKEIGLIEKIPLYKTNKYIYKHLSPVISFYYYLDEKYNFSEKELSSKFIARVLDEVLPKQIENFFRNLFAKIYGLDKTVIQTKDFDIDIALTKFKRLEVIAEVKWKNKVSKKEINHLDEIYSRFEARKKYLIVPSKKVLKNEPKELEVLDVNDILKLI